MPKPSKPLERRTPLQAGQKALKRTGRLRARSSKMDKLYRTVRRPLVNMLMASNPLCIRCLSKPAVDPHEVLPRGRGGSITDPANCVPLCRECHTWIGENIAEAEVGGWLRRTNPPKCPTCKARLMKLTGDDAGYLCGVCQLAWSAAEVAGGPAEFELAIPWTAAP
ncbi:MAG TPA: HNH endonuclease signature motif containing protein [Jatrophihabitans sp.]|nr:HNH endonuclease signature motif containing protein [Jatrophihabitans sp.]